MYYRNRKMQDPDPTVKKEPNPDSTVKKEFNPDPTPEKQPRIRIQSLKAPGTDRIRTLVCSTS